MRVVLGPEARFILATILGPPDDMPVPDTIEIHTPDTGRVQMTGCDGATMRRDGRQLAQAADKDLVCDRGRPITVESPGEGFTVAVTLAERQDGKTVSQ